MQHCVVVSAWNDAIIFCFSLPKVVVWSGPVGDMFTGSVRDVPFDSEQFDIYILGACVTRHVLAVSVACVHVNCACVRCDTPSSSTGRLPYYHVREEDVRETISSGGMLPQPVGCNPEL